jgi:hypothetical protein
MSPAAGARCAKHPETAAVDVCQRCGAFACGDCLQIRSEDAFCADCGRILDRPAPARSMVALTFAAAPVPVVLVLAAFGGMGKLIGLGLSGLLMATAFAMLLQERSARRQGRALAKGAFYSSLTWLMLALDVIGAVATAQHG